MKGQELPKENEGEGETYISETIEQHKSKIRQVYEQLGALTRLEDVERPYDILELSPIQCDMTFETGLKAME
ncbi:hypothetical protein CPB97_007388 [Podila verticillata]|nr:hypothetical protein CPB97_007388 [Podila verticillata]